MLTSIARLESTPPLYYALAWLWSKAFGTTEAGMRSLPALIGLATVPVTYAAARELASRRAALFASAVVAVNPLMVWYSQEARSYSLLTFLSAAGLYWFARARRRARALDLVAWSAVSCLALATHYFAAFFVVPEAVLLLRTRRGRRAAVIACAPVAAAGAALFPLLLHQRSLGHATWIGHSSLGGRALSVPAEFTVGFDEPMPLALGIAGAVLAALGAVLALTAPECRDRRGVRLAAAIGLATIALPFGLALAGLDYFNARNAMPALIVLGAGYSSRATRLGPVAGGLLVALSVGVVMATAGQPKFRSEDWRAAADDLARPASTRMLVVAPGQAGRKPFEYYLDAAPITASVAAPVREVNIAVLPQQGRSHPPRRQLARILRLELPGLVRSRPHLEKDFVLLTFRARHPVRVSAAAVERVVRWGAPKALVQGPSPETRLVRSRPPEGRS